MQKSLTEYRAELSNAEDWICEVPLFPLGFMEQLRHGQARVTAKVLRSHYGWLSQPNIKRLHCHGSDFPKKATISEVDIFIKRFFFFCGIGLCKKLHAVFGYTVILLKHAPLFCGRAFCGSGFVLVEIAPCIHSNRVRSTSFAKYPNATKERIYRLHPEAQIAPLRT